VTDKELPDSRRNRSQDQVQGDEISSAQTKPRMLCFFELIFSYRFFIEQFQQRVKHLMTRQKNELKSKGQKMPSHSELKKPEQIVKNRTEKRQRESLQRARQMRKGGRTNYKNQRNSNKAKHARRVPANPNNQSKRPKKK
jgi:hypothetical protein